MIVYCDADNWIIAGGIYTAYEADKNSAIIIEFGKFEASEIVGSIDYRTLDVNEESIITFVGHGCPGNFSGHSSSEVVDYLRNLGLSEDYNGVIDFYTCFGAIWNVDDWKESLVDAVKDAFPYAIVRGALGACIVDNGGKKHVVKTEKLNLALGIQNRIIQKGNYITIFNQIIKEKKSLIERGCRIREAAQNFYTEFLVALYENDCLLDDAVAFKEV